MPPYRKGYLLEDPLDVDPDRPQGRDYEDLRHYPRPEPKSLLDRVDVDPNHPRGRDYQDPYHYSRSDPKPLLDTAYNDPNYPSDRDYKESQHYSRLDPKPLLNTTEVDPPGRGYENSRHYSRSDPKPLLDTKGDGLLPTPTNRDPSKPVSLLDLPDVKPTNLQGVSGRGEHMTEHQQKMPSVLGGPPYKKQAVESRGLVGFKPDRPSYLNKPDIKGKEDDTDDSSR